jgi:HSP20 family protein
MRRLRSMAMNCNLSGIRQLQDTVMRFAVNPSGRIPIPSLVPADKRWLPPTDLFETEEALVVVMDISGIDHREVSVKIEGHTLTIRGLRRELKKYSKRHYYLMEIDYGPFERRFHLPRTVDADHIEAHYADGFLEVVMPKQGPSAHVIGPIGITDQEDKDA